MINFKALGMTSTFTGNWSPGSPSIRTLGIADFLRLKVEIVRLLV